MNLHRGQLEALSAFLAAIRIQKPRLPLPGNAELFETFQRQILDSPHWKSILGRMEFGQIVWRIVYQDTHKLPEDFEGPIESLDDGVTLNAITERMTLAFQSLPRSYDVYIPMASLQTLHQSAVPLTESIAFVDGAHDEDLKQIVNVNGYGNALVRAMTGKAQLPVSPLETRYLRITCSGYADDMPTTSALRTAWSIAKQIAFVGTAAGNLVTPLTHMFDLPGAKSYLPTLVVAKDGDAETYLTSASYEFDRLFCALRFANLRVQDFTDKAATLLGAPIRPAESAADLLAAIPQAFTTAIEFLALNSPDASSIRTAMEWSVDADLGQNETVSFLQRCIGLEALLGSTESRKDVTDRLADRYAYLVGKTTSVRNELRKCFIRMYGHRSEIVHGRSTTLSDEHREASWQARSMLIQATWTELLSLLSSARQG